MPGLWSIYGKNMNYLGGLEGTFRKNRKNARISENTEAGGHLKISITISFENDGLTRKPTHASA